MIKNKKKKKNQIFQTNHYPTNKTKQKQKNKKKKKKRKGKKKKKGAP
jgi:hypothetical protein